jgi:hypothetical protein
MKCPGQDMREWKPGDIFEIICPCAVRARWSFSKTGPAVNALSVANQ